MKALTDSFRRIHAIAINTLTEALRQKTLHVLLLFGVAIVASSNFFTQFAFQEQFKFLKDIGYAGISWTGLVIALLGAAQLIPAEMERRTIYVVMSKPVRPFEFILGKYMGLVALLTLMIAVMSVIFAAVLWWKEAELVNAAVKSADQELIAKIHAEARDPRLLQAVFLVWAKLCVIASISVLLSTVATSTIFIISMTVVIYIIGHLQTIAREMWASQESGMHLWERMFLGTVTFLVPDLNAFNLIDEIIAGHATQWNQTGEILLYSSVYVAVLILVSSLIFENREL
ncbi:MAG: ABC transporter permease subunit [bacterium]